MLLNIMTCLTHARVYRREGGREREREGGRMIVDNGMIQKWRMERERS